MFTWLMQFFAPLQISAPGKELHQQNQKVSQSDSNDTITLLHQFVTHQNDTSED